MEAIDLFNSLHNKCLSYESVMEEYNNLTIHSVKEIDFDFTLIKENERSKAISKVVESILNKEIDNNYFDIKKLLGVIV